jgi:hypothetical protein
VPSHAEGLALRGSRLTRLTPPLALAGLVLGASVVLHLRDPHTHGSYGFCPWLALTGTYCPGCGGLRAVNDLTDLRVADAASSNLLLVLTIPLFAAGWLRSVHQRWTGVLRPWPAARLHTLSVAAGVLVVAFWVVRNLPFAGWLTP